MQPGAGKGSSNPIPTGPPRYLEAGETHCASVDAVSATPRSAERTGTPVTGEPVRATTGAGQAVA
jgi:hypothetical protein